MTKRIFIILYMTAFSLTTISAQMRTVANPDDLHTRLARHTNELQSIESDFIQQKYLDVFDETITSKGKFYYKKENKIRMDYSKPLDYLIVINGNQLKILSDGKRSIMNLSSNKMMNRMQDMLTACMVGDLSKLTNDYELSYYEDDSTYLVRITPLNQQIQAYIAVMEIRLNKTDMSVETLRLSETETDHTEYIFTNKKFNTLPDEALFDMD